MKNLKAQWATRPGVVVGKVVALLVGISIGAWLLLTLGLTVLSQLMQGM